MSKKPEGAGRKIIAQNKKVRRNFELIEFIEAGLSLLGPEVKSLRAGRVSFGEGYVVFRSGEAFLTGVHIPAYENSGYTVPDPDRERKLLLHRGQIDYLTASVEKKGLTVVPVSIYFKGGKIKVEIALARGKNLVDRRHDLKSKAVQRDTERELMRRR